MHERDAQDVVVIGVVDVILVVLEPFALACVLRYHELCIVLADRGPELGLYGQMAIIVDGLAQQIAAMHLICSDFRHREVGLR